MTVSDRAAVVIQIFLYFVTQIFNLLTDVGILLEARKALPKCDNALDNNVTNSHEVTVNCSSGENFTRIAVEEAKTDLNNIFIVIAVFGLIGVSIFTVQLVIYIKYLVARGSIEFEHKLDTSTFLKHFYKIHGVLLLVEAILHDLAIGFVVVELCMLIWKQPNCWECVSIFSNDAPKELSLSKTNLWLGIKLVSLVPVTLYKGMFPMFMWIGGPFCGMDCYICRVCVVIPCGLLAAVLLMTPICGTIILRLIPAASGVAKGAPNTVWSIGLIFWAITVIVCTLFCVACVPCCRTCCFRYGVCKWFGLDCCGLGDKKKEKIKKEED